MESGNNMKKGCFILGIILLLAACSLNELGTSFYAGQEVNLSSSLIYSDNPQKSKQRISGKDNGDNIDLTWDKGDQILVTVGDQSSVFTLLAGEGTNNAIFKGIMPADGHHFHVSYPIDYTNEILTNQVYTANGFGKRLMRMSSKIAGTLDNGFVLSEDNAVLGLELQGDVNVNKIVLTNNDNQKTYTLDCSANVVNTEEPTLFYIVVPAGTWTKGFTIEVYNSKGVVIEQRNKTNAVEFVAGQAMMMPKVELYEGIIVNANGITFKMIKVEGNNYNYLIGQTEVTRALWKAVTGKGNIASNIPIDNVTTGECQQFIHQLNQLTGLSFRFPTNKEWLYAAKGGPHQEDFLYSGSNNIDEVGWYNGNTTTGTQPVATLKPNALGIYDMTGNVWEWVTQTNSSKYQYWGGSYAFNAEQCLLSKAKGIASNSNHTGSIGLRLVLDNRE